MKRIMTFAFALTIAAALALTTASCSNEDILTENNEQPQVTTNGVQVTVDAGFDEASTRSAVADDGTKRTLKFTTGDQLYVYGEINAATSVAGYLTMDGSPTNDDKSATFTGTVKAYDISGATPAETTMPAGEDPLALCINKTAKATLVHKDLNTNAIRITLGANVELYTSYMSAADVNTLMTTSLPVQGDYTSASKSFALSSTSPIINCLLSGFEANSSHEVGLYYEDPMVWIQSFRYTFTADANGVINVAFVSQHSGSKHWRISVEFPSDYYYIDLGTRNLTAKVYNVSRCWAGNRFIKLNGKFTINAGGDQVYFAPGNLQATTTDLGNTWSWHFAANQWDCIGGRSNSGYETETGNNFINGNGTVSANGTVDLFGWVGASSSFTGAALYGISNSKTDSDYGNVGGEALKSDWGNTIGTGWRTLTSDEWKWLLGPYNPQPGTSCRTSSTIGGTVNARWLKATVNSVKGLIIFPDVFAWNTTSMGSAPTTCNTGDDNFTHSLTSVEWTAAEAAGAVFLPAARRRNGSSVTSGDSTGEYWTSSPHNESNANSVFFYSNSLNPADYCNRYYGCSVRLVRDVN